MTGAGETAPPVDRALLDLAVAVAREAGEVTLEWFGARDLAVEAKADGTPVTAADRAAERLVRERLAAAVPDDGVLGEEEPETPGRSGRRWIVDPIDGTKGFARGVPLYTTLLALDDEHGPAVGVIAIPAQAQVVAAGRGLGCWWDGAPARVSDVPDLDGAYLMSSSYSHWPAEHLLAVQDAGCVLRTWGDGYGYALVATGRAEAMVDHEVARYDVAAMPVILAEAGGRFTSLAGEPGAQHGSGVASNGLVHDALLARLRSSGGSGDSGTAGTPSRT
ncbi:MAG TPA: inositol monophosphatase family protein [Acidimicrobiales bacterium]|nr:inositol monophosphatase family protein [Acidimicrobiales bacterium]